MGPHKINRLYSLIQWIATPLAALLAMTGVFIIAGTCKCAHESQVRAA